MSAKVLSCFHTIITVVITTIIAYWSRHERWAAVVMSWQRMVMTHLPFFCKPWERKRRGKDYPATMKAVKVIYNTLISHKQLQWSCAYTCMCNHYYSIYIIAHADMMYYFACCRDGSCRQRKAGSSTCKVRAKRQSHKIDGICISRIYVRRFSTGRMHARYIYIIAHQPWRHSRASKVCATSKGYQGYHICQVESRDSCVAYPWWLVYTVYP